MDRILNARANETETNALARRLVERSGLDEGQASQAVEDYLYAEGGTIRTAVTPPQIGKVDLSQAS